MTRATKTAVFMMGGPGSGKSYIRQQRYADMPVLDCDQFKMAHPDYDPKNPQALHAWSAQELVKAFHATIAAGTDFCYDGTGSTAERYVQYIRQAQALGYDVTLCYVKCSMRTAIERNRTRARTVPEDMLRDKHALIATSFEIISGHADHVVTVEND